MWALLTPFSVDTIHYAKDFQIKNLNLFDEKGSIFFLKNLTSDITIFLDNLSETDNYCLSLYYYPGLEYYCMEEGMKINISEPILINKGSCPILLSNFIMSRLNLMIDFYYLDDSIINSKESLKSISKKEKGINRDMLYNEL